VIAGVGVTVITVNYFDPQNCQASTEIIINVGEVITPVILSDLDFFCEGDNIQLLAQNVDDVEFIWSFPDEVSGEANDSPDHLM